MPEKQKPKIIFVCGGPGSGKGTVCEKLISNFGFKHYSAGDLLREEVKKGTELGKTIDRYVSNGEMVPGEVTVNLVKQTILQAFATNSTFIIDGYPRNIQNIEFWNKVVKDDFEVVALLYLKCSEETMKARILNRGLSSGRSDDNEEIFKKRIRVFWEESVPAVDYYRSTGKVYEISSEGSKEECYNEAA